MKKLRLTAVLLCTAMFLTACGGKDQSAVYRMITEQNGITMTDTMNLHAKGDSIQEINEVIELNMSAFGDDICSQMSTYYDELAAMYQAIEGVECTTENKDKIYTITVNIDATGDAVNELAKQGLMEIQGDSEGKISLEASGESLEANGFEKVDQ